jgi:hypothetical protein
LNLAALRAGALLQSSIYRHTRENFSRKPEAHHHQQNLTKVRVKILNLSDAVSCLLSLFK